MAAVQTGCIDKEKSQQVPETRKSSKNRFRLVEKATMSSLNMVAVYTGLNKDQYNHERWNVTDLWVEKKGFIRIANLKFYPEKFTLSKLFATMYFKKGEKVSSFPGNKLTTSLVRGTSEISTVKERRHIINAHLKII